MIVWDGVGKRPDYVDDSHRKRHRRQLAKDQGYVNDSRRNSQRNNWR